VFKVVQEHYMYSRKVRMSRVRIKSRCNGLGGDEMSERPCASVDWVSGGICQRKERDCG